MKRVALRVESLDGRILPSSTSGGFDGGDPGKPVWGASRAVRGTGFRSSAAASRVRAAQPYDRAPTRVSSCSAPATSPALLADKRPRTVSSCSAARSVLPAEITDGHRGSPPHFPLGGDLAAWSLGRSTDNRSPGHFSAASRSAVAWSSASMSPRSLSSDRPALRRPPLCQMT